AHPTSRVEGWDGQNLLEVVKQVRPTVLLGVCGQPGIFTEDVVKTMHAGCDKPLIMPLSNPTSRAEAQPEDILKWTNGEALVATGSPFAPVEINGRTIPIAQGNNDYILAGSGPVVFAAGPR